MFLTKMLAKAPRISATWRMASNFRYQSTSPNSSQELISVDINEKTGISIVKMNSKPVNSMTLNFIKDFCEKMDFLEKQNVKGLILTSSVKNVFSSGLDFHELFKPEESRINAFWLWFQESWLKLYGSSFPTVALINGHAPAGGCVYSISCDYRVMLPNFTIGLNEAPVGIVPPGFIIDCARSTINTRQAEMALTMGTLFTSEEALKIGMIDEIAVDEADALARCEAFLEKSFKVPAVARALTKLTLRRKSLEMLRNPQNRSADAKLFIDHILRPSTQKDIENYVAERKKNKMK